jgi:hypothetical protein
MLPRLTGLVSVVREPKSGELYPICSGVVIFLRNYPVLLTVAHYLNDVLKWKKEDRLDQLALLVHANQDQTIPVILEFQPQFVLVSKHLDIGCLILSREELRRFCVAGGVVLDAAIFADEEGSPETCILAGHSSAKSKTCQEVIAIDEKAQQEWRLSKLTVIPAAFVRVMGFNIGDAAGTLRYIPARTSLSTYAGTSGGPVFGISQAGDTIRVVAVQASERAEGRTVVSLTGTCGSVALQEVERILDECESRNGGGIAPE